MKAVSNAVLQKVQVEPETQRHRFCYCGAMSHELTVQIATGVQESG